LDRLQQTQPTNRHPYPFSVHHSNHSNHSNHSDRDPQVFSVYRLHSPIPTCPTLSSNLTGLIVPHYHPAPWATVPPVTRRILSPPILAARRFTTRERKPPSSNLSMHNLSSMGPTALQPHLLLQETTKGNARSFLGS
jgi:hypothetical protein